MASVEYDYRRSEGAVLRRPKGSYTELEVFWETAGKWHSYDRFEDWDFGTVLTSEEAAEFIATPAKQVGKE
jgi:hypothetical protein